MAGRPKTRARKLAEALAAKQAMEAGIPVTWESTPSDSQSEVQKTQTEDRTNLHQWWNAQFEFMEAEQQAIDLALKEAGVHPCPIFAKLVRRQSALGVPPELIATKLGVSDGVLFQHYEADLRAGEGLMLGPVAANMYRMATAANGKWALKAATEILTRRGGAPWKPPAQKVEITDDRKTPGKGIIDSAKLSWEEREQLRAIVERQLGMRNNSTFLTNGLGAAKDNGTVIDAGSDNGGEL